jgi:hypothetical protein
MAEEHAKNARPSSRQKHQEGQARKLKEQKKAAERRKKQKRKRHGS